MLKFNKDFIDIEITSYLLNFYYKDEKGNPDVLMIGQDDSMSKYLSFDDSGSMHEKINNVFGIYDTEFFIS